MFPISIVTIGKFGRNFFKFGDFFAVENLLDLFGPLGRLIMVDGLRDCIMPFETRLLGRQKSKMQKQGEMCIFVCVQDLL